jgi:hypothetical protein
MTPSVLRDASLYINPKNVSAVERDIKEKKKRIALKQVSRCSICNKFAAPLISDEVFFFFFAGRKSVVKQGVFR